MKRFEASNGDLIIYDDQTQETDFRGKPNGYPVSRILHAGEASAIIFLDPNGGPADRPFENIIQCKQDGSIEWRAELPELGPEVYVAADFKDQVINAVSWTGQRVLINPSSGRIISTTFVK